MVTYNYEKLVRADQLQKEIEESSISVAISYIDTEDENVSIHFEDDLSEEDKAILDNLVEAHIPIADPPISETKEEKINRIISFMQSSQENGSKAGAAILLTLLPLFTEEAMDQIIAIMEQ